MIFAVLLNFEYNLLTEFGLNMSNIYWGNEFAKNEPSQFEVLLY